MARPPQGHKRINPSDQYEAYIHWVPTRDPLYCEEYEGLQMGTKYTRNMILQEPFYLLHCKGDIAYRRTSHPC